jgi:hypothetical protein
MVFNPFAFWHFVCYEDMFVGFCQSNAAEMQGKYFKTTLKISG